MTPKGHGCIARPSGEGTARRPPPRSGLSPRPAAARPAASAAGRPAAHAPRGGPARPFRPPHRPGPLARRLALLLLALCAPGCSETGLVSHYATVVIRNDIQDPALYGPAGQIAVRLDAADLGPLGVSGGKPVATLTPRLREVAFETDLGPHSVLFLSTDPADGATVYKNSISYSVEADGAIIEIRVTADGSLCFIGGLLEGVPCENA